LADTTRTATSDEVRVAIEALTPQEVKRLALVGRAYARSLGDQGDDLVAEALHRALDGRRKWKPDSVGFLPFILGVMKSVRREYFADTEIDGDAKVDAVSAPAPNAERTLIAVQTLEACEREFADDHEVLLLIQGFREDKTGTEICAELGMTRSEFETVRRRMTRHLAGWKSTRRRTGA
jgi:DNA-directed RNA polymerase specialized sigma24 family protein